MDENNRNEYTGQPESPAGTPDPAPVEGDWTADPYPEEPAPRAASQEPPAEERRAAPPPPPEPPRRDEGSCVRPVEGGQLLHAYRIGFVHPRTGEELIFEADPEPRFTYWLEKLRMQ